MKSFLIALLLAPLFALSQTLPVNSPVTLTSGSYSSVEVFDGAAITIDGEVTFQNMNPNNTHPVSITITKKGKLTLASSLNQNGKFVITNNGTLNSGSHEMQSGQNVFQNNGTHNITGDLQLLSGSSTYTNCGIVNVSNFTSVHSGDYVACNCGILNSGGLNVTGSKKISGKGFIKVTGNTNLNGLLTESAQITFCGNLQPQDEKKLGEAQRSCVSLCDPLPVSYEYVRGARLSPDRVQVSFKVTDHNNAVRYRILKSTDGKNFFSAGVVEADKANPNRVYTFEFNPSEK